MKHFAPLLAALAVLLALGAPAAAQDTPVEPHPLLALLELVPDVPATFENVPIIGYVDYEAMQQARPGVGDFPSGAVFAAAREAGEESAGLWMANSQRLITGPVSLGMATFSQGGRTRDVIGFDLFDIDRALVFGVPPQAATILQGDFDPTAVVAAYEAREYAVTQHDGLVILARADGEPGSTMDIASRDVANPFGGEFGRKEPLILANGLILNSPSEEVMRTLFGTLSQTQRDVTSRPSIVAAAEAVTQGDALLVQAAFLDPRHVAVADVGMQLFDLMLEATPDVEAMQAALVPHLPEGYGSLPFYTMAVMADRQLGDDQMATLALVYDDKTIAQQAAEELTTRLSLFRDTIMRRDDTALLEQVEGARMAEPTVYFSASTGKYVAIAGILYPTPPSTLINTLTGEPVEPGEPGGSFAPSGRVIRYWFSALYSRAFDVLYVTE